MALSWQDALMKLHVRGWNTDGIDVAAESLSEACSEGAFEGMDVLALSDSDVARVLTNELPADEARALKVIADLRAQQGSESDELQRALYDLDAFAYAYAGDD